MAGDGNSKTAGYHADPKKQTASILSTPVIAVSIAVLLGAVLVSTGRNENRNYLLSEALGVPPECWETHPPSSSCILIGVPKLIGLVTFILIVNGFTTLYEKPSKEVLEMIEQQSAKRHELVEEIVQELELSEDLSSDEIGGIKSENVGSYLVDLGELPTYDPKVMSKGFHWAFALLEKELRVVVDKTREGIDIEYSTGEKLEGLAYENYPWLMNLAKENKCRPNKTDRKRLWTKVREARRFLRRHGIKAVIKACKLLLFARKALVWVALKTVVTTVTAVVMAFPWYYRAEVLENLGIGGEAFWQAAKAMALVELLGIFLGLLSQVIGIRGEKLVAHELQLEFFSILARMDLTWWAMESKKSYYEMVDIGDVYSLEEEVASFLQLPQDYLTSLTAIVSHVFLIMKTSSKSLYLLLAVNFGQMLFTWFFNIIDDRLCRMSIRGLVFPAADEVSFYYILSPQYIAIFQSFVRVAKERKSFALSLMSEIQKTRRHNLVGGLYLPIMSILGQTSSVMQMSMTTEHVQSGMGVAEANAMLQSADEVAGRTRETWSMSKEIIDRAKPLAKVYDLCTLPKTIDFNKGLLPKEKAKGHIQFENVRFSYPKRNTEVLKGVNFEVKPGQTLGMTGSAGCGKSTAMRLLERFYDVTGGRILLDGVDLREYNPQWLHSQIATVAQEPVLIPTTIRDNIAFGCDHEPTLEEIYDACRAANIYDSLMDREKFPSGIRTKLSTIQNISGGEKQRIAIARAILADPPILLLDEATSALDEENQEKVQDALNKLMEGRTTLVIAHRLSTIRESDCIVAFSKGKVVECGSHDELLKQEHSVYAKLWRKQSNTEGHTSFEPDSSSDDKDDELQSSPDDEEDKSQSSSGTEEDQDFESPQEREFQADSKLIAAGMNPPPSTVTRLSMLEQRLADLPMTSGVKEELLNLAGELKEEAVYFEAEKNAKDQYHAARKLRLKVTSVNRWKAHVQYNKKGSSRLQLAMKKVILKNRRDSLSKSLEKIKKKQK